MKFAREIGEAVRSSWCSIAIWLRSPWNGALLCNGYAHLFWCSLYFDGSLGFVGALNIIGSLKFHGALWYNGPLSLLCLFYGALKLDGLRSLMMVLSLFMAR